jgi:hypothetical protein
MFVPGSKYKLFKYDADIEEFCEIVMISLGIVDITDVVNTNGTATGNGTELVYDWVPFELVAVNVNV